MSIGTRSALQASENFEPSSEWVDEETFRTLLVHLPGFKTEQIKAQITNTGHINISGERPLEGRRRSKFTKQYPLPEHCKVAETRAKFENETLHVRFSIDQPEVASPLVPTPTMHKSPSSPMERTTTTELGEKAHERNGKTQKAVPEEKELQRKQKQPEAKKEIDRNEQPKATGNQEKKHETLQDKERSEEGRSNSDKIQGQQMVPALKTDDTSSLAKKQKLPESSSFLGSNSKSTGIMAQYRTMSLFTGLPPAKKTLLVNVAVAGSVLLGIGLYLMYK